MKKSKKSEQINLRPLGEVTGEMEELLFEMVDEHQMQVHEVLHVVYGWIQCHYPSAVEEYEDGSRPFFFYGPNK